MSLHILFLIFLMVAKVLVGAATVHFLFTFFLNPQRIDRFNNVDYQERHEKALQVAYFFLVTFGFGIMVFHLADVTLSFLPSSFGYLDEDKAFVSYRFSASVTIGLFGAIGLVTGLLKSAHEKAIGISACNFRRTALQIARVIALNGNSEQRHEAQLSLQVTEQSLEKMLLDNGVDCEDSEWLLALWSTLNKSRS